MLIHCVQVPKLAASIEHSQGSSRSGSTTLAYLMSVNNWTLAEACEHCKALHPDLCPNKGFFWQLQEWEYHLVGRVKPSVSVPVARKKGWCGVSKFKEDVKDWSPQMPHLIEQ